MIKRIRRILPLFTMWFLLLQANIVAFAAESDAEEIVHYDTGNAVSDILRDDRFSGAISSIKFLTDFIDIWFIRIISLVSFFIISAALLKNVCAGAYVSNSKFWDKVDDAHKKSEAISISQVGQFFSGGGWQNTSAGSLKDFLLGIVPNIKAFTDFEDADIEPKAYFMKSIPQMLACVCIGIFIYNGYYRDTAAQVGEMGSVIIDKTLNSVDPESLVNSVFNSTSWPDFPWKGDSTSQGKTYQELCNTLKGLINSNYTNINSAEAKSTIAINIANSVQQVCDGELGPLFVDDGDYMYTISGIKSYVSMANSNYANNSITRTAGEPMQSDCNYVAAFDLQSIVGHTTDDLSADKAVGFVTFTMKISVNDGSGGLSGTKASELQAKRSYEQTSPASIPSVGIQVKDGKAVVTVQLTLQAPNLNIINTVDNSKVPKISDIKSPSGKVSYENGSENIIIQKGAEFTIENGQFLLGVATVNGKEVSVYAEVGGTGGGSSSQGQPGTN